MSRHPRRVAVVLGRHTAAEGSPPGVDPAAFEAACLADTYEVVADLVDVTPAVAVETWTLELDELIWPGSLKLSGPDAATPGRVVARLAEEFDELVLVPADVPDLPGLVPAKIFQVLHRSDLCISPERGGPGCAAIGVTLPLAPWLDPAALDLDADPYERLLRLAPEGRCLRAPGWHRLRTRHAVHRLDPGLEGWELTRALLEGRPLG